MKALTLWRPWPWAIVALGKPVENRGWPPPRAVIGERIALHAGKRWDDEGAGWIRGEVYHRRIPGHMEDLMPLCEPEAHPIGIVATAVVEGYVFRGSPGRVILRDSVGDVFTRSTDEIMPWFVGRYGWVLGDIVALPEPVPCRGAQGLWTVPPDVEARVRSAPGSAPTEGGR